eukprot:15302328-Alexandrium_andersonii.AAC.1
MLPPSSVKEAPWHAVGARETSVGALAAPKDRLRARRRAGRKPAHPRGGAPAQRTHRDRVRMGSAEVHPPAEGHVGARGTVDDARAER